MAPVAWYTDHGCLVPGPTPPSGASHQGPGAGSLTASTKLPSHQAAGTQAESAVVAWQVQGGAGLDPLLTYLHVPEHGQQGGASSGPNPAKAAPPGRPTGQSRQCTRAPSMSAPAGGLPNLCHQVGLHTLVPSAATGHHCLVKAWLRCSSGLLLRTPLLGHDSGACWAHPSGPALAGRTRGQLLGARPL